MALGWTQPLIEMSTGNLPGGKGRPGRKINNLTAICEPHGSLDVSQHSTACYRTDLPLHYIYVYPNVGLYTKSYFSQNMF
jgi:hypothetical protein